MANHYTFRVDEVEGVTRESVKSFLNSLNCQHVVCYEISSVTKKPHYQGWVRIDMSQQTWANRIKKQWPAVCSSKRGRSSGHYSGAVVRKDTYESYCLKGTATELPDIVSMLLAPFQTLDVESIHRKWWSTQASTSPKIVHIVEEGIAIFKSYDWPHCHDDMNAKRMEVALWLSNKYAGKGKNSFLFKNYINGILSEVDSDYNRLFCSQIAYSDRW